MSIVQVWAKPRDPQFRFYCAIISVDDSRWRSACRGSWASSTDVDTHDDPPADKRCPGCVRNSPVFEFDMSEDA